jgi:hypothetical protein
VMVELCGNIGNGRAESFQVHGAKQDGQGQLVCSVEKIGVMLLSWWC